MMHLSTKIQEVTSNVMISKKNEKVTCEATAKYTRDLMRILITDEPV